ncbi:MAG: arginine--tRNA ligase, partial [Clostridia bacterium]|nr:arginine--tRNA ligase [Clostridia bacterium]
MENIKNTVAGAIASAVGAAFPDAAVTADEISALLEYPPDDAMGDVALPCFKLSKILRKPPAAIAASVAASLSSPAISSVEAVNGYLNVKIHDAVYISAVGDALEKGDDYGKNDTGRGRTLVIDYSSPNVAKPFHIGHLGSTVIGHSIKMLHAFSGWNCVG